MTSIFGAAPKLPSTHPRNWWPSNATLVTDTVRGVPCPCGEACEFVYLTLKGELKCPKMSFRAPSGGLYCTDSRGELYFCSQCLEVFHSRHVHRERPANSVDEHYCSQQCLEFARPVVAYKIVSRGSSMQNDTYIDELPVFFACALEFYTGIVAYQEHVRYMLRAMEIICNEENTEAFHAPLEVCRRGCRALLEKYVSNEAARYHLVHAYANTAEGGYIPHNAMERFTNNALFDRNLIEEVMSCLTGDKSRKPDKRTAEGEEEGEKRRRRE